MDFLMETKKIWTLMEMLMEIVMPIKKNLMKEIKNNFLMGTKKLKVIEMKKLMETNLNLPQSLQFLIFYYPQLL